MTMMMLTVSRVVVEWVERVVSFRDWAVQHTRTCLSLIDTRPMFVSLHQLIQKRNVNHGNIPHPITLYSLLFLQYCYYCIYYSNRLFSFIPNRYDISFLPNARIMINPQWSSPLFCFQSNPSPSTILIISTE